MNEEKPLTMNPLKFRIPQQGQTHLEEGQPRSSELPAWLEVQAAANIQNSAPEVLNLLKKYNRRVMPNEARLKALILLQPVTNNIVKLLREKYQHKSLPLDEKSRKNASLCLELLDELAIGYKIIVSNVVAEEEDKEMSTNLFVAALHLTVDHLGQLLMECYSQYRPLPEGLWGELHRLYYLAEQNKIHDKALPIDNGEPNPLATIKHAYLRPVLLALTQPNHLMPGQATTIFEYLSKWTAGCRLLDKKVTVADAGDIFVDLAGERPPAIATGHAHFHPENGRYLDMSQLQTKLNEMIRKMDKKNATRLSEVTLTITERLQRNLISRVNKAWQGRVERKNERQEDGDGQVSLCVGLDAAHHFSNNAQKFDPEKDEIYFYHPPKDRDDKGHLELLDVDETPWDLDRPIETTEDGLLDRTRLSRFGEEVDVWGTSHNTEFQEQDKREAVKAHFKMGAWLRMNKSTGGMSLRQLPENPARVRVGALVAYLDHAATKIWKIGIIRWLQDNPGESFDVGVMNLAKSGIPIAVRAIGGAGAGGEYFRSLLVKSVVSENNAPSLIVPASIYDVDTQLVLNLRTEIKYVRLTNMAETTSSFSLFEFKYIDIPPAEKAKIDKLGREEKKDS